MSLENGEILKVQSSSAKIYAPQFETETHTETFHPPPHWLQERKTSYVVCQFPLIDFVQGYLDTSEPFLGGHMFTIISLS